MSNADDCGKIVIEDSNEGDDESYTRAKPKAESSEIDLPPGNKDIVVHAEKNKKRRVSLGMEHAARTASLESTLQAHNFLIAESSKNKLEIEKHRLEFEETRVKDDKEERAINREVMLLMVSMMKSMSETLAKFSIIVSHMNNQINVLINHHQIMSFHCKII
jgi:hypothetical protein